MRRILLLSAFMLFSTQAMAGGFMIGEMATRSTGMASAFTAISDDASAAWHNPAGVAFSSGSQAMVGGDIILTQGDFVTNTSNPLHPSVSSASDKTFFVPHTYLTYWDESSNLGASLSINAPFGLETEWPTTAAFSSKNTFSRINMVLVNPSIVYKLTDSLSIAAGVDYANMYKVNLDNTVQTLSGDGDGWGGNASIFYKGDGFNFGVTYRSQIKVDVDGTAVGGAALAAFGGTTTAATTSVTLPDQINVGLAYMPNDQWTLSLDVDWVNWDTYDSIDINYASGAYRGAVGAAQVSAVVGFTGVGAPPASVLAALAAQAGKTNLPQNWSSTVAIRAGAEWKYNSQMRARFGYIFDPTPIEDVDFSPSVPGNDRHIFSVGYGYDLSPKTTIDLAYAYVYIIERTQTASTVGAAPFAPNTVKNGTYNGDAHILMASVNHRF